MYDNGQGVAEDKHKAAKCYRLATTQEFIEAPYNLGAVYVTVIGVRAKYQQAYARFSLAAEQGNKTALKNKDIAHKK